MNKLLITGVSLISFLPMSAEQYVIKSPDNRLTVTVNADKQTSYSVDFDGKRILDPSPISMTFDNGAAIGRNMNVKEVKRNASDKIIKPIIRQKSATIRDNYNSMQLHSDDYNIEFRVYD